MNKFRFLTFVLLFAGLAVTSCQKSPTNSLNDLDNETEIISPDLLSMNSSPSSSNDNHSTNGLEVLSNSILSLEAGSSHTCAFYPEDGNVICWGNDSNWEQNGPEHSGSTTDDYLGGDAIKADIGTNTNCVLKEDGTTECWGYFSESMEYTGGDAIDLGVGGAFACVVKDDGNVDCITPNAGFVQYSANTVVNQWETIYSGGMATNVLTSYYGACVKTSDSDDLICKGWNTEQPVWDVDGVPLDNSNGSYAMCVLTEEGNVDCMNSGYNNGSFNVLGPQDGYVEGYHRTDESMPKAVDMDAASAIGCYALDTGDIKCFIGTTGATPTINIGTLSSFGDGDFELSIPGVNAVAVSTTNTGGDICYADASGNITCSSSTPDEYATGPSDTEAPVITFSNVTNNLWPPNHKMQMVGQVTATDESSITAFDVTVSSNESSNGRGDGNTDNDHEVRANGMGGYDIYVRAERSGKGEGRTYTITATAEDEFGNAASNSFEVSVAKSKSGGRR